MAQTSWKGAVVIRSQYFSSEHFIVVEDEGAKIYVHPIERRIEGASISPIKMRVDKALYQYICPFDQWQPPSLRACELEELKKRVQCLENAKRAASLWSAAATRAKSRQNDRYLTSLDDGDGIPF